MKLLSRLIFALMLGALGVESNQAQTSRARTTAPRAVPRSFDVASIKPNQTDSESRRAGTSPGGLFTATNVTLKLLIARAFGVAELQVERGPGWIDTEKYDIEARANTPLEMSREEVRPCLQALLAERFRLTFHREIKEVSVYSLAVAKNGPKLTEHSDSDVGASGIGASSGSGKAAITGTKATMARLAEYLSSQADRPVTDNTGLKGEYDFRVEWATEEAIGSSVPSLFTGLQEQLGLKMEATKGPIQMIVIDGVQKASPN